MLLVNHIINIFNSSGSNSISIRRSSNLNISFFIVLAVVLLNSFTVGIVEAGSHNAPVLRFSKNALTPNGGSQLICSGGTAKASTFEKPIYIFCISTLDDIFNTNAKFKCQNPNPSSSTTLSKFNVVCKRDENDFKEYTFGDDHPCYAEYEINWIESNQIRVIGWGILGMLFFYLFLKRANNSFYQSINNPMSFPRESTNPKVFLICGVVISLTIVISTIVFILLCLYMFSAQL